MFRLHSPPAARALLAFLLLSPAPALSQQACAHPIGNGACIIGGLYPAPVTGQGPFRTVCVRPTDGFFFPISFSAARAQLASDEASCAARCRGGILYYHLNPGGSIEDAVDRRGARYRDSPNAFAYRTDFYPGAACEMYPAAQPAKPRDAAIATDDAGALARLPTSEQPIRIVGPVYNAVGVYSP